MEIKSPWLVSLPVKTAPAGRRMGHAGAIIGGAEDTAAAKMKILRECGVSCGGISGLNWRTMVKALGKK